MAPKRAKVVTKRAKKPTKKATGAKKAAEAPVAPTPVTTMPQPEPEPVIQPNPEPPVPVEPVVPAKPKKGLTPEEEIVAVEKEIASLQARLWELQHPIIEFPKMVTPKVGPARTFNSREEQDAAGPDYADKK